MSWLNEKKQRNSSIGRKQGGAPVSWFDSFLPLLFTHPALAWPVSVAPSPTSGPAYVHRFSKVLREQPLVLHSCRLGAAVRSQMLLHSCQKKPQNRRAQAQCRRRAKPIAELVVSAASATTTLVNDQMLKSRRTARAGRTSLVRLCRHSIVWLA